MAPSCFTSFPGQASQNSAWHQLRVWVKLFSNLFCPPCLEARCPGLSQSPSAGAGNGPELWRETQVRMLQGHVSCDAWGPLQVL